MDDTDDMYYTTHWSRIPGGGDLVPTMPRCVCPKVKDIWVLFQLQGSDMSENISLKMGVKFAASLNMGKNLCSVL